MHQFLVGDELGNIKRIRYGFKDRTEPGSSTYVVDQLYNGAQASNAAVQAMTTSSEGLHMTVSACANKTLTSYQYDDSGKFTLTNQWTESRMSHAARFVGLSVLNNCVYSCTSNGALRKTNFSEDLSHQHQLAALPNNLAGWRVSPTADAFTYAGDEVDVSVWDFEKAFASQPQKTSSAGKRKRSDVLLPAEIWRAKNTVASDGLGLRQPVRVSALAYLNHQPSGAHIFTGTQFGDVRRYDIRAGRKPVSDWNTFKNGSGVKTIEAGVHEQYEPPTSFPDLHSYPSQPNPSTVTKVISFSLSSFTHLVNIAVPSPSGPDEQKGEVLEKIFVTSTPTVVICDRDDNARPISPDENEDDVWQSMEHAVDEEEEEEREESRKQRKRH
ncbi:hypothetical protein ONZ45_g14416 [Pleurotus djamor]|nr:hypothetical protein ONZ45_g14416 [Pleurotus djamor]